MKKIGLILIVLLVSLLGGAVVRAEELNSQTANVSKEQEKPCDAFDKIFQEGEYSSNIDKMHFFSRLSYIKDNKLFLVLNVTNSKGQYQGIIEIYPEYKLVMFGQYEKRENQYLSQAVEEFLKNSKLVQFSSLGKYYKNSSKLDLCYPLSPYVDGKAFSDGVPRKFVHHFPQGKRVSTGDHLRCENWNENNEQIHFYKSFFPHYIDYTGIRFYVDELYGGVLRDNSENTSFQYICNNMQGHVSSFLSVLKRDSSWNAVDTLTFLQNRGLYKEISQPNKYMLLWEKEILRNILEGQELLNQNTLHEGK